YTRAPSRAKARATAPPTAPPAAYTTTVLSVRSMTSISVQMCTRPIRPRRSIGKESVRADFRQRRHHRAFVASSFDCGREGSECRHVGQWTMTFLLLLRDDVHKAAGVAELERGIAQSDRLAVLELFEHFPDVTLVLGHVLRPDRIPHHRRLHIASPLSVPGA